MPKITIRNNSNIVLLVQQTLKDVEQIQGDIAGFDMSYDELKSFCRESWRKKHNFSETIRFEDENCETYRFSNESNEEYKNL